MQKIYLMGQIVLENIKQEGLNKKYNYIKINRLSLIDVLRIFVGLFVFCLTAYAYLTENIFFEFLIAPSLTLAMLGFIKLLGSIRSENTSKHE